MAMSGDSKRLRQPTIKQCLQRSFQAQGEWWRLIGRLLREWTEFYQGGVNYYSKLYNDEGDELFERKKVFDVASIFEPSVFTVQRYYGTT
jgi:hypothetical protein